MHGFSQMGLILNCILYEVNGAVMDSALSAIASILHPKDVGTRPETYIPLPAA